MIMPEAKGAILDSVSGSLCSQTAGGSITGGRVICGFTAGQVNDLIAAAENRLREQNNTLFQRDLDRIETLSRKLGASEEATENLLRLAGAKDVPPDKRRDVLAQIFIDYQKNNEVIVALRTDDPVASDLLVQARKSNDLGQFNEAKELLAKASDIFANDAKASDEAVKKAAQAAEAKRRAAANAKAAQAGIALTQREYVEATALFEHASDLLPRGDAGQMFDLRSRAAEALYRQGDERGDNAAFKQAIAIYQTLLAGMTRERAPLDWATTQMNLGTALARLGERESGTARLEEAVVAFNACLTVTASVWPISWLRSLQAHRNGAQAEIARRSVK